MRSLMLSFAAALLATAPLFAQDGQCQVQLDVTVMRGPKSLLDAKPLLDLFAKAKMAPGHTCCGTVAPAEAMLVMQMCREKYKAKFLAEPKLVTLSGRPAHFLSGGQQAMLSPVGGLGGPAVSHLDVGTELDFLPVLQNNGRIYLEMGITLRSVNKAQGIVTSVGFVPGFEEHGMRTSGELASGESFLVCQCDYSQIMLYVVTPHIVGGIQPRPFEPRTAEVAKRLAAMYHEACASGDREKAREFAQMALDLDPLCLSRSEPKPAPPSVQPASHWTPSNVELLPARQP